MASKIDELIAFICTAVSCGFIIWILNQRVWIINNKEYQEHQAFKVRGQKMFFLTAFILILNFGLRPILVAFSLLEYFTMNVFWRLIIDAAQMSLYTIIELRCWMTYFNFQYNTAIVNREWKLYLNTEGNTTDFFIKCHKWLANYFYVGMFFLFHGIACVVTCDAVERYYGYNPYRIICHFFVANVLLFVIFIHRMYTLKHHYSTDILAINKELNLITLIMTLTAICDFVLDIWYGSVASQYYVIYQTILIGLLSLIIFHLPRITINKLLIHEREIHDSKSNMCAPMKDLSLKHVFTDTSLYYSFMRYLSRQEWTVENLLFLSQWMQLQKIIVDSEINVIVNQRYTCDGNAESLVLFSIPSDILLMSANILEAARCLYDKFVKRCIINISHRARGNLQRFFTKYANIRNVFDHNNINAHNSNNMEAYHMFIDQLKPNVIDINIIQEMIGSFKYAVNNCWVNTNQSCQRFRNTIAYRKLSWYQTFQESDHTISQVSLS
eukprot:513625_1